MTPTIRAHEFIDLFCGAGGASEGLERAGLTLKLGANHWKRAIETHAANFPDAEHLCADINHVDMRNLPAHGGMWASVICIEGSPANGQRKRAVWEQQSFEEETGDHVPRDAWERTRACAYDVMRAAEVHGQDWIVVENVNNFILKWPMFDWWFAGMEQVGPGYNGQILCVSSAHVWDDDNAPAPQWRDRVYVVFTRKGIPLPDLRVRPLARCFDCDMDVRALQHWKNPKKRRIGSYGRQYVYRCERAECGHAIVEPYVAPCAIAIDWTDLGIRIGDRASLGMPELVAATERRIRVGCEMFGPAVVAKEGNTWERPGSDYVRAWPALTSPFTARTGTPGDGLALPKPFLTVHRKHSVAVPADGSPMACVTAGGFHNNLVIPPGAFIQKHHGGLDYGPIQHMLKSPFEPLATSVGKPNTSLVIPFRRGAKPHRAADRPLSALTTRAGHALVDPAEDLADVRFRMLKPREHLSAQRFPSTYIVHGNQGEQQMQAGNAVSCNVAQHIGTALVHVLGGAA